MSRILFFGDLAATGFGTVTMDLGRAMLARGEDVRFISLNERGVLPEPFASRTLDIGSVDGWIHTPTDATDGALMVDRLRGLCAGGGWEDGWAPDGVVILGDFMAVRRSPIELFLPDDLPAWHYVPIEGVDLPPRWAEFWRRVTPVAMSNFGATEIERITGRRPPMIYHGVDTTAFRPVAPMNPLRVGKHVLRNRSDCRRLFGGDPARTWLLRTDRHMPRKRQNALLRAMFPVLTSHPDVDLVLHCHEKDQGGNLEDTLSKYPRWYRDRVLLTGPSGLPGMARDALCALYNAADLYVTVSAEGFGLTIAEALACGVPAVGPAYSAVPEVIGPAGVTVEAGALIDNEYDHFWWAVDENAYGDAVADLLDHPARRTRLGTKGPAHIRNFRWDRAAAQFAGLIQAKAATNGQELTQEEAAA